MIAPWVLSAGYPLLVASSHAAIASWKDLKRQAQSSQASTFELSGSSFDSSDYDSAAAITASIAIDGNGAVLDASKGTSSTTRRFFSMETGDPALSLRSLTLANGYAVFTVYGGGAIYSCAGSVNLTNCTFTGNTAKGAMGGGAIFSGGPIFVVDTLFTSNTAGACGGGAIYAAGGAVTIVGSTFTSNDAGYNAGALYASASAITVVDSNFSFNSAQKGGAIGLYSYRSTAAVVMLSNVTLRDNAASDQGAAVFCGSENKLTLNNSVVLSNNASASGGSVYVEDSGDVSAHCSTVNASRVVGNVSFSDACLPPQTYRDVHRLLERQRSVRVST